MCLSDQDEVIVHDQAWVIGLHHPEPPPEVAGVGHPQEEDHSQGDSHHSEQGEGVGGGRDVDCILQEQGVLAGSLQGLPVSECWRRW